jgi:hypothetical protein
MTRNAPERELSARRARMAAAQAAGEGPP